jgi:tripartite-type tricarboxylate transporter receptor subunit TctC
MKPLPPRAAALAGTVARSWPPCPPGAQAYPDKPLRIMVGASPGGGTDILARMLADKFAPVLKQP